MKKLICAQIAALCASLLTAVSSPVTEPSLASQIKSKPIFPTPLTWTGSAEPTDAASSDLLKAFETFDQGQPKAGIAALEEYLQANPTSGWDASIRVNLAEYYRSHGRYSQALAHWETVWNETKNSTNSSDQKLAVRAVAGWTRLLASLGEKAKVETILAELDKLQLRRGSFGAPIEETREGVSVMNVSPGKAYRCGSFALGYVAQAMHLEAGDIVNLFNTESPDGGFNLSQLLGLAKTNGLELTAVRRPVGGAIIVPSVIHWKLNHFAAVVERKGDRYKLMDPTFGGQVWLDADTIDAESSGAFLVPKDKTPAGWQKISAREASKIYGKGFPNCFPGPLDGGPPGGCGGGGAEDGDNSGCEPPSSNDGPGGSGAPPPPPPCCGMPTWDVSEPYINLWLSDVPLAYRLSDGKWMNLLLRYKQRGEDKGSQIGNFGPNWECNWIGFMASDGTTATYSNHVATGGVFPYDAAGAPQYNTGATLSSGPVPVIRLQPPAGGVRPVPICVLHTNGALPGPVPIRISSQGAQNMYATIVSSSSGSTNYFLTQSCDQYGRVTQYNYATNGSVIGIASVIDRDGLTNTLAYNNATFPNLITDVTNAYGFSAHFAYDSEGRLTNITDEIGLSTFFQYRQRQQYNKYGYPLRKQPVPAIFWSQHKPSLCWKCASRATGDRSLRGRPATLRILRLRSSWRRGR